MKQLDNSIRSDTPYPERVLQFGEGNFLRAFIDWMLQRMNEADVFHGRAVVVQPIENGLVDLLNEQDGLYTLYLRGIENGQSVSQHELIASLSRGINPYRDWESYLQTARHPEMRFVVSNTTEAGIAYVQTEKPSEICPVSFPAKLAAWLWERYSCFGGSAESGMILLPCELINHNGTQLKTCVLRHAEDWDVDEGFTSWIEEHCVFLNTLVDRIVPGYPRDELADMTEELGYEDKLLCTGERFHLLVIEGPERLKAELPFHEAGLNVVWTDDMQPYRTRKVGVLNGAHTASVLGAFLGGLDTVRDMMEDEVFGVYIRSVVFEEIVPALDMDRSEAESFAEAVMERFQNPFIRHELLSISLNSVSKWKVRVLPSLKKYYEKHGRVPPLLSFSLAALIAFYKGDLRVDYRLQDAVEVLSFFKETWGGAGGVTAIVDAVLGAEMFWGEDLRLIPGFADQVSQSLESVLHCGTRQTVKELMKG